MGCVLAASAAAVTTTNTVHACRLSVSTSPCYAFQFDRVLSLYKMCNTLTIHHLHNHSNFVHTQVLAAAASADDDQQQQQQDPQQPLSHFSKMRVSQLQTFLKQRGQPWDFSEKSARALVRAPLTHPTPPPPPPPGGGT